MRFTHSLFKATLALMILALVCAPFLSQPSHARSLRDLIKRQPELYLPSQIVPGQKASFTVRGKAGQAVKVILSSANEGLTLPDGRELRLGKPSLEATGLIPETGVLELEMAVPENYELFGEYQYVEAITWHPDNAEQVEVAQIIQNSGIPGGDNVIEVNEPADGGYTMVLPGDAGVASVLRSIGQMNDVSGDERKKKLIDDGAINRERQIDRTLGIPQQATPGPGL